LPVEACHEVVNQTRVDTLPELRLLGRLPSLTRLLPSRTRLPSLTWLPQTEEIFYSENSNKLKPFFLQIFFSDFDVNYWLKKKRESLLQFEEGKRDMTSRSDIHR